MNTTNLVFSNFQFKAMGSPCEIKLFAATRQIAEQAAQTAFNDIRRLEAKYSRYRQDSFISTINSVGKLGKAIEVDDETASLLDYAATCYQQSDGLFDITSGVLRTAWQFKNRQLPSNSLIDKLLTYIGWQKLQWQRPTLQFLMAEMEIDFGGIVKEYAADRVASIFLQAGIAHGVINLGGDVKIMGPRPDGSAWRIGISHPREPGALPGAVALKNGAIASSGDYERFIQIDGIRYSHILNPKTGWPVRHLAAVSVNADFCVLAGSAATIAMLKETQGPAWLEAMGLPHLWIDNEGIRGGTLLGAQPSIFQ